MAGKCLGKLQYGLCAWNEGRYEVQYGGALTPTVKKVSDILEGEVDLTV